VKHVQAAEVGQRRAAVSSKCFQLYYTCSDRLLAITLPSCSFHLLSPLTVTFPKLSVILRPLYVGFDRMRTETEVMLHSFPDRESFLTPKCCSSKMVFFSQFTVPPPKYGCLRRWLSSIFNPYWLNSILRIFRASYHTGHSHMLREINRIANFP
jgi:hypothetical protein